MNDLKDLQWQAAAPKSNAPQQANDAANYNPIYQRHNNPFSLNATFSGTSTRNTGPAGKQSLAHAVAVDQRTNQSSNALDSFNGLVDFGGARKADMKNMTLAQQAGMTIQALVSSSPDLLAAIQAQRSVQAQQTDSHFANASFFEAQLSRTSSTSALSGQQSFVAPVGQLRKTDTETSEDIMNQINGNRPVNAASFYPPPPSPTRESTQSSTNRDFAAPKSQFDTAEDIFQISNRGGVTSSTIGHADEDDILGELGKPIDSVSSRKPSPARNDVAEKTDATLRKSFTSSSDDSSDDEELKRAKAESLKHYSTKPRPIEDPQALLVQQIVDMGYTRRQAQVALAQTDTGSDLNAAVELLLSLQSADTAETLQTHRHDTDRHPRMSPAKKQSNSQADSGAWVDTTYDLASKTLASANSWFSNKSALARRKLAEFNAETAAQTHASRFDERPKWMRDAEKYERKEKGKAKAKESLEEEIREEGLPMHPAERRRLEMNGVLPTSPRRGSADSGKSAKSIASSIKSIPDSLRPKSTMNTTSSTNVTNGSTATRHAPVANDPRRFKANDDESMTFVSSRRRRPPAESSKEPAIVQVKRDASGPRVPEMGAEDDLFGAQPSSHKGKGKAKAFAVDREEDLFAAPSAKFDDARKVDLFSPAPQSQPAATSNSADKRRKPPGARQIPYLDTTILAASSQQRLRGSEHFKKGDFASALNAYQASLSQMPAMHPVRILSLTNRAITQIHLGASKLALEDCDEALMIIGTGRGAGEVVDDSGKQTSMSSLWVKAMSRKASALEMQERHEDALKVWQDLVKSGLGDASSVQARQRCENMLAPKVKSAPANSLPVVTKPSQAGQAAVRKLREDDARIAQDEAQKDSLYSAVNMRISTWSAGKETNLRALLSSLDQVLWETSGWKKVTLADLVINAKVKVIYMKALAKVHPDKISRTASVEEKMIAAGVFAKLNGAWDSFKAQNNM